MPDTTINNSFTPFISEHVQNNGETLELSFTTKPNPESDVECGQRITLSNCNPKGITDLTSAILKWRTGCDTFEKSASDTNENEDFYDISLDPDDGEAVTSINISIDYERLQVRNEFELYGIISDVMTLLARGVIYTTL